MAPKRSQEVRIIGGKWSGRKLRFQHHAQLRPTLSRTRETLFNWLRPTLHGMRCLDLFAGSGALGFEALSQGASDACFVDQNRQICNDLRQVSQLLGADTEIVCQAAQRFVRTTTRRFDLIFVDPPFDNPKLLQATLAEIKNADIASNTIYIECRDLELLHSISNQHQWPITHSTRSGHAHAILLNTMPSSCS